MAKAEPSSFSAEHIAQFNRIQQVRKQALRRMGDALEIWRGCEDKVCQRARSCKREDATCLFTFMSQQPDESRREMRYALENRRAGLSIDEACARAESRVKDEIRRFGPSPELLARSGLDET